MGRPAYQITRTDFADARQYILNAMNRDEISNSDGWAALRQSDTPELLQRWCDDYLSPEIFKKLKNAVLAARKRSKKPKIGVDLTHTAHLRLSSLSSELGLTLSEAIITLEETYWLAVDAGLVKKKLKPIRR